MSREFEQISATSAPASMGKNLGDGKAAEKIGRVVKMVRRCSNGK